MNGNILLVDDEKNLTDALKHTLYKEKYSVFTAGSASEALGILNRENIDVIVTDERMPGMSGSELIAISRNKYPDTIRIILTGQASSAGAIRAINEGDAYRFLIKPCNGLDLVITLRRALQYKQLFAKSRQMALQLEQAAEYLQQMEKRHPEIFQAENPASRISRSFIPAENLDDLLSDMDAATKKLESLLHTSPGEQQIPSRSSDPAGNLPDIHVPAMPTHTTPATKSISPGTDAPHIDAVSSARSNDVPPAVNETSDHADTTCHPDQVSSLKDLKPILTRTEIKEILDECGELKGMSPTVAKVLKLTQSSQSSIENVVKVMKQDHAISLIVMKIANSVVYTRGEPVDTIQKSVMRIGLAQIRQVVLNISVINQFNDTEQNDFISIPHFWEHSIATGMIAAMITRDMGGKEQQIDAAFTMGLLHDLGRLVYQEMLGGKYEQILQIAHKLQLPVEQVESRMLLVNHADAMDRILRQWKFAKELVNPIALHQLSLGNIRRMAPRTLNEVAILALANRLAHALLLGSSGNLSLYPTEDFADVLKIKADLFQQIEEEIPDQTDDVKFSMLSYSNQNNWPCLSDELNKQFQQPFKPLFLSAKPDFDSLRIFCNRLRDNTEPDTPPNIGIIHIKNPRERVMITSKYKTVESEADLKTLPLIIFSPKGNIQLEENAMQKRQFTLLSFPVTVARIIDAFNTLATT